MSVAALEADGVTFSYGRLRKRPVLTDFSWAVAPGQTTMLLGPNGAGKSTLLKLLCGFESPDAGKVRIAGEGGRRALYNQVGWMPQDIQPARGLTVTEQVGYAAWVGGESLKRSYALARDAVVAVDLEDKKDVRTDRLSGGQLRRVGLAQAIVRKSPVLLLDEPTAGLDPAQSVNFRRLLSALECPGGIVISTHQANDLAEDVDRVAVIAEGAIRFDGTAAQLEDLGSRAAGAPVSLTEAFTTLVGGGRH